MKKVTIRKVIGAFTLIEMLIVVTVVGILASVLTPKLRSTLERVRDVRRIKDVKDIGVAFELFKFDQGVYPNPSLVTPGGSNVTDQVMVGGRTDGRLIYNAAYTNSPYSTDNHICYTRPPSGGTTLNADLECSSLITVESLIVPNYLTKMPRTQYQYMGASTTYFGHNMRWQWTTPRDYYEFLTLPKNGKQDQSFLISTIVEDKSNANRLLLGLTGAKSLYNDSTRPSVILTNWTATWNDQLLSRPTATSRYNSVDTIKTELCSKVVYNTDTSVGILGVLGGSNGGTCYMPKPGNGILDPYTDRREMGINRVRGVRYLYLSN